MALSAAPTPFSHPCSLRLEMMATRRPPRRPRLRRRRRASASYSLARASRTRHRSTHHWPRSERRRCDGSPALRRPSATPCHTAPTACPADVRHPALGLAPRRSRRSLVWLSPSKRCMAHGSYRRHEAGRRSATAAQPGLLLSCRPRRIRPDTSPLCSSVLPCRLYLLLASLDAQAGAECRAGDCGWLAAVGVALNTSAAGPVRGPIARREQALRSADRHALLYCHARVEALSVGAGGVL